MEQARKKRSSSSGSRKKHVTRRRRDVAVERGRRARLREGVAWGSSTRAGRCAPYNDFALYPQVSVLEEPHLDAGFLRGQGAKGAERSGVRSSEYGARALAMSLAGMCSHILQKPEDQVLRRYPSGRESSTTASRISGTEKTTKERQRGAAKKTYGETRARRDSERSRQADSTGREQLRRQKLRPGAGACVCRVARGWQPGAAHTATHGHLRGAYNGLRHNLLHFSRRHGCSSSVGSRSVALVGADRFLTAATSDTRPQR